MKRLFIMLLICNAAIAQTRVEIKNFIAADYLTATISGKYTVKAGGYADYAISVPVPGSYVFSVQVSNSAGANTSMSLKDPATGNVYSTASVPLNANWQTITLYANLTTATTSVRLWFADGVTLSYFVYQQNGAGSARQSSVDSLKNYLNNYVASFQTFTTSLSRRIDSLNYAATNATALNKYRTDSLTAVIAFNNQTSKIRIDSLTNALASQPKTGVSPAYVDSVGNLKLTTALNAVASLKKSIDTTYVLKLDGRVFGKLADSLTITIPLLLTH